MPLRQSRLLLNYVKLAIMGYHSVPADAYNLPGYLRQLVTAGRTYEQ